MRVPRRRVGGSGSAATGGASGGISRALASASICARTIRAISTIEVSGGIEFIPVRGLVHSPKSCDALLAGARAVERDGGRAGAVG